MPSRITYKYLKVAQNSIQSFKTKRFSTPPQISLVEKCIQIADIDLSGARDDATASELQVDIRNVLREAAANRDARTPAWAGYAEAILHFVERTLGMQSPPGGQTVRVHPQRARGQVCGTYSTPDFVASRMIRQLIRRLRQRSSRQIDLLDLSLEAGQFPLSLLIQGYPAPVHFYGIDRDPVALGVAERLGKFGHQFSQVKTFRLTTAKQDSLLDRLPKDWPDKFTVVVGNPPWKGGHSDYHERIRDRFAPFLTGHFDLYLAFMLRAHQLVRPGGYLAFVVPSTFLFNHNASEVRRLFLKEYDILDLDIYPQRSFIEVPCLIPISILARKRSRATKRPATMISYHPSVLGGPQRPRHSRKVSAAELWRQLPGQVFHPLVRSNLMFLHKVNSGETLQDFGEVRCGARLSRLDAATPEVPFLGMHARHIRMFHACSNVACKYDKRDAVFSRPPSKEVVDARKILFQDVRYMTHATRLVAAVGEAGVAPVSTASLFIPWDARFVEFYAALLNSQFANGWYKLRDVNRSVKLFHLRNLPVIFDEGHWQRIGQLACECCRIWQSAHERFPGTLSEEEQLLRESPSTSSKWNELRRKIDDEIFNLYRISSRERKDIAQLVGARTF